jgi:D-serine deaminase-like pyridoxal phosphate-dependent protein
MKCREVESTMAPGHPLSISTGWVHTYLATSSSRCDNVLLMKTLEAAVAVNLLSALPADVLTPALVIDEAVVERNIQATLDVLGGDAARWRPHVKTSKVPSTVDCFLRRGITNFKCCTSRELLVLCKHGATDVLFAHAARGAAARRVAEIAGEFPGVRMSVLVEDDDLDVWKQSGRVGIFVDINPGMDRTGIPIDDTGRIAALVSRIMGAGLHFRDCTATKDISAIWISRAGESRRGLSMTSCLRLSICSTAKAFPLARS